MSKTTIFKVTEQSPAITKSSHLSSPRLYEKAKEIRREALSWWDALNSKQSAIATTQINLF